MPHAPTRVMTNTSLPPFAPLPVRARTTLEIFDTAFKLFRRYAGVLLGWAFLSSLINLIPLGGFAYILTLPLFYGAVSCVIAAAVRGQNVRFGQVWGFTKARYGAMVGVLILAGLLFLALVFGVSMGVALLSVAIISLVAQFGAAAYIVAWIVGILVGTIVTSLFLAITVGWFTLAPIVACLEDQHRGSSALSRALSLMSGRWGKACAVSLITSLASGAAAAILASVIAFVFYGGFDKMIGANASDSASLGLMATSGGFSTVFLTFSMPIQALVIGVFYLDLRTRKEALDLEWTNYAAQPELSPEEMAAQSARPMPPTPPPALPVAPDVSPSTLGAGAAPPTFAAPPPIFTPATNSRLSETVAAFPEPLEANSQSLEPISQFVENGSRPPEPNSRSAEIGSRLPENGSPSPEPNSRLLETNPASMGNFSTDSQTPPNPALVTEVTHTIPLLPPELSAAPEAPAPSLDAGFGRPQPTPPPLPTKPPTQAAPPAPSETSSFAPPRRAEPDEDPDFPSSFGGGGRR